MITYNYTRDLYTRSKHSVGVAWHHIWCQEKYVDLRDQLNFINLPGLFLHREKDPLIPIKGAIENQKLTQNSTMLAIPRMGHMIFNRDLEKLIAKHLINYINASSTL